MSVRPRDCQYTVPDWTRETQGWLAGILEGEGCFHTSRRPKRATGNEPRVSVYMTDRDIVERVKGCFGGGFIRVEPRPPHKTAYKAMVTGYRAVEIMVRTFPMLGARRRRRIQEVIYGW